MVAARMSAREIDQQPGELDQEGSSALLVGHFDSALYDRQLDLL